MFGYRYFLWNGLMWRSLPYGAALLSSPREGKMLDKKLVRNTFFRSCPDFLYVRWEHDFDSLNDSPWWHVLKDKQSSCAIESYSSNTRNQIRRGLKSYYCAPISSSLVGKHYCIYSESFDSYNTFESKSSFEEFVCQLSAFPPTTEFWGVFSIQDDCLVGFCENYIDSSTCFINSMWILPTALKGYASYALFHEMTTHYLIDRSFEYVSDGARSISHDTQIHHFLIDKFHFRKAYSILRVEYVLWLKLLILLLYPFRAALLCLNSTFAIKLSVLLSMEEIHRLCGRIK